MLQNAQTDHSLHQLWALQRISMIQNVNYEELQAIDRREGNK